MNLDAKTIGLMLTSLAMTVGSLQPPTAQAQGVFPFFSDFESDNGGLTATGSWGWGLPTATPDTAHSGFLVWGTNLQGNYPDEADDYLDLPPIDLTNISSARLSFWHWYEIEEDEDTFWDGANVKVSVNGGPFEVITPFRGYDGVGADIPLEDEPVFGGFEEGAFWQQEVFNLQEFVGNTIVIRFHFGSDCFVNYSGWYIDDVAVAENLQNDVAVRSIDSPTDQVNVNAGPVVPIVTVYNAGTKTQSFETEVAISLDGIQEYVSKKMVVGLAPNTGTEVEFDPWTPSRPSGTLEISAQTLLTDDEDPSNDFLSINGEVFEKPFSDFTSVAGLESVEANYFAWGDYDNDGDMDLFIANVEGSFPDVVANGMLYRNNGHGRFHEDLVLPIPENSFPLSGHWGDFDNDGDLDLFIVDNTSNSEPHTAGWLFRNDNSGFVNVTDQVGFELRPGCCAQAALWFDYDNDGYLDLYVEANRNGSENLPNQFYHNNGDGTFAQIAATAGVENTHRVGTTADYDDDGLQDLLVQNTRTTVDLLFYRNKGDGTFEEISAQAGITNLKVSGSAFGDYDNDGQLDLYLSRQRDLPNRLYHNNGDGTFTDLAMEAGVDYLPSASGAPAWGDYDNDGYLDLLILATGRPDSLRLYHNNGDGTFSVIDPFPPLELISPNDAAWADLDNDGDLDLLVSQSGRPGILLRNETGNLNNWVIINLLGTQSNKNGYGARIRLRSGGLLQVREITGGSGRTHYSLRAHFGLGSTAKVDSLEVRWPSGIVDYLTNVDVNQIITIEEGNGMITGVPSDPTVLSQPREFRLAQNYPNPFNPETRISFKIGQANRVLLRIYNLLGQEVVTLVDERRGAGEYMHTWDGKNRFGESMPSGIYVYRLEAGKFVASRKMLLLR